MKYILLLSAMFLFTACNSAHKHEGHDHSKMEGHECSGGCDHHKDGKEAKDAKPACGCGAKTDAKQECSKDCKDKAKGDRKCCSEKKACATTDGKDAAACSMETATTTKDNLLAKISGEDLTKAYTTNKDKLGKTCSAAASAYCGKTSRDMMINETELSCLWTKVFRATRETLPKLDGTDCAKMIKTFAKK